MSIIRGSVSTAFIVALFAASSFAQLTQYAELDNVEGPWVNINHVPTRPMLADGDDLYAVNTHDSTVEKFSLTQPGAPLAVWGMPWSPVAITGWRNPASNRKELIVACRGSYCLVRLSPLTGRILAVIPLPPGPADVLVDQDRDVAFVSCADDDSVVEVDLPTGQIVTKYSEKTTFGFRMKRPTFLSFLETEGMHRRVLVAPLISGNNSSPSGAESPNASGSVLDLEPTMTPLPDEDLFLLDPLPAANEPHVTVLARDMGTILFAHGIHPTTGRFWQLNTEHDNKNPNRQSEPAVNGEFANDRITIIDLPAGGSVASGSAASSTVAILDPYDIDPAGTSGGLGGLIDTSNTVGQPYALAFGSDGNVLVAGLLTDNVLVVSQTAAYVKEWDLPTGAIPRGILTDSAGGPIVHVYCWGTNEIISYDSSATAPTPLQTWSLNHDPTPPHVQAGREVFYDASFSKHGNLSCATCHVDGGTDLLSWNLSAPPIDDKGPMMTQTLRSLEKMAPFHWRGERAMGHFRPAVQGLLGSATEMAESTFGMMEDFIFSMNVSANPFQNRERRLDGDIFPQIPPGLTHDPDRGQALFRTVDIFIGEFNCNECHAMPTGTINDINIDFTISNRPRRAYFKPAPFHDTPLKRQSLVGIISPGSGRVRRGYLGASIAHTGIVPDLLKFIEIIAGPGQDSQDITSFVNQFDTGLAPAVHAVTHLDGSTVAAASAEIAYLESQAGQRYCDVVVFGTVIVGQNSVAARWVRDGVTGNYRPDDPALATRTSADFINNAANESNTFLGVPVGMGERFAIDYDLDGNLNPADTRPYIVANPNPQDGTGPQFTTLPRIVFSSAKVARLAWETDEPATALLEYRETGTTTWTQRVIDRYAKAESVVINDLRPSTDITYPSGSATPEVSPETVSYEWRVTVTDRSGNPTTASAANDIVTKHFIRFDSFSNANDEPIFHGSHVTASTDMAPPGPPSQGIVNGSVDVVIAMKQGGGNPADDRVVVGRLFVQPAGTTEWIHDPVQYPLTAGAGTTLQAEARLYRDDMGTPVPRDAVLLEAGPYLLSGLTTNGSTNLQFTIGGVASGDKLMFNVEAVVDIPDAHHAAFASDGLLYTDSNRAFLQWSFADSGEDATRSVQTVQ